jgi:hypothetical protein
MSKRWPSAAAALTLLAGPAAAQDAPDLSLRRVMLSTGGVGYYEWEAEVTGNADLSLSVPLDQVADVMKSIVVYDDAGGVGEISLPGREPLAETFRELPFDEGALSSPVALLQALRGAEVRAGGARAIEGRLIAVTEEQVALPDAGGVIVRHRVSLMTAEGMRQFILEDADSVSFVDAALQEEVGAALAAVARFGERDRRTLDVRLTGSGTRTVHVAYVVGAPLWKSSYRLTLPSDAAAETADLQGWAVLENLSGVDWEGVELTVVSGNPVTFRQALYDAYYVFRPEVPVEVLGRVLPPADTGAVSYDEARSDSERDMLGGMMPMAPSPAPMAEMSMADMQSYGAAAAEPQPGLASLTAAESTEAATQVVFRLPEPVSVAAGHSLLVPIISREVPAERLVLYQPETQDRHPLASVELANDGESGLPPGVLTLYERLSPSDAVAFVGDARLAPLPQAEERLISYAVDQKTTVDREDRSTRRTARGRIVDGTFELTVTERATTIYTIEAPALEARTIIIEHPRWAPDWGLVEPAEAVEATPTHYRIRRELAAGETMELPVTQERPVLQVYDMLSLTPSDIEYFIADTDIPEEVRGALGRLGELKAAVEDRSRDLDRLEASRRTTVDDQGRTRANLDAVPEDSDLYRRYVAKLSDQEDAIERLDGEIGTARETLAAAQGALVAYVRSLRIL